MSEEIIKATILGEEHLGENLKKLCIKYIDNLKQENQELKKQLEKKYSKPGTFTTELLYEENIKLINQQKEFIEYLENEKDRLARECSQIYEDELGKTRLVNEDVFNEVDKISIKYKEIIR